MAWHHPHFDMTLFHRETFSPTEIFWYNWAQKLATSQIPLRHYHNIVRIEEGKMILERFIAITVHYNHPRRWIRIKSFENEAICGQQHVHKIFCTIFNALLLMLILNTIDSLKGWFCPKTITAKWEKSLLCL